MNCEVNCFLLDLMGWINQVCYITVDVNAL